jgi:hypothetical protein
MAVSRRPARVGTAAERLRRLNVQHGIEPQAGDRQPAPLGYAQFEVGLNNQKVALCGLFLKARDLGRPLVLPDLCTFDPSSGKHGRTALDRVYPIEILHRFARAYGIGIVDAPSVDSVGAWDCFVEGSTYLAVEGWRGPAALDGFGCQFFRHLLPRIATAPAAGCLKTAVFRDEKIRLVVQLRVEKDWLRYSEATLSPIIPAAENYNLSFLEIFHKIKTSLGQSVDSAYIVCDENDLPASKDEIRAAVSGRFGMKTLWKSDVLDSETLRELSTLDRTALDFEVALAAPAFVGLSRSTFSNMVGYESFCRTRRSPPNHFIYNGPGDHLGRRYDNGSRVGPHEVMNPIHLREPLVPLGWDDIHWPVSLCAHVSTLGDFVSEGGAVPGVYGGPIVCGLRHGDGQLAIEGFSLTWEMPSLGLEYRALRPDATWSAWAEKGEFVGTRGMGQRLLGFSVRLTGPLSLGFQCICFGSFVGKPDLVQAALGQDCAAEPPRVLRAMQIVFRRT